MVQGRSLYPRPSSSARQQVRDHRRDTSSFLWRHHLRFRFRRAAAGGGRGERSAGDGDIAAIVAIVARCGKLPPMGTDDSGQQWEPFPETSWTAIGEVWAEGPNGPRHALGALLKRYMPALRARLVIEKGIAPDKAGDLLSGFTADKILERNLISRADRSRGRFRTFLLTALDRYVVDEHRAA